MAAFPEAFYLDAAAQGKEVVRIDAANSLIEIEVRRDGALAAIGHDHLIASHDVQGYVMPQEGRADLYVMLDKLTVDEPDLRKNAGFTSQPPADAIAGTRRNMLEHVFDMAKYPVALVHIERINSGTLDVALTLKGVTQHMLIPASIDTSGDTVAVKGKLSFKQSEFGIVPFSALGGALQVRDEVDLRFHIWAK